MTRTRIGWGMAESQWRIACGTVILDSEVSGHKLKTNQNHRRTSVLKEDGATRADAVLDIIQRGTPMIYMGKCQSWSHVSEDRSAVRTAIRTQEQKYREGGAVEERPWSQT